MPQQFEIEQKYRVESIEQVVRTLQLSGFIEDELEQQVDVYFRHPCRDFRKSGEAFRLRRVGEHSFVTYKGPKFEGIAKVREEMELRLETSEFGQWEHLLASLGFVPLPAVRKTRRNFHSPDELYRDVVVTIDTVEELGIFVEIEMLVRSTGEFEAAQQRIVELGGKLGLQDVEKRSYLSQLLTIWKLE